MKKLFNLSLAIIITFILLSGCAAPRKFAVTPQMKEYEFTVEEKFGTVGYVPATDNRGPIERRGMGPNAQETMLGDKNYETPLLDAFNNHMKKALSQSGLFDEIKDGSSPEVDYVLKSNLEQFQVYLDEKKAQSTQKWVGAFGGACIGAAAAGSVDVDATSDIRITGTLFKGDEKLWQESVTKHVHSVDDYTNTIPNTEKVIGDAIGEGCKEIVTALAKYLSSK